MANALDISKALSTQAASTGDVLIPEIIQAGIREYFEQRTPIWNQFRKESVDTNAVMYKLQDSVPVASFGAELGPLPAAQNATYSEEAVVLKSIYSRGEISGQLIAASRSFVDVLQREVRNHTIGMINTLETTLVTGDATARPAEFDGLNKWITNEIFATSDGTGAGTDEPLTLNHLEVLMDAPRYAGANVLFMNSETRRRLWSVLQPQIRFIGETEINGGFRVRAYNDMPIIEVKPNVDLTTTPEANLPNTILAVNTDMVWIPVLQDLTYEELAHTRDSTDFIIKMYVGMIVEGGEFYHAKLTNFTTEVA
jgi:hypothetical protein